MTVGKDFLMDSEKKTDAIKSNLAEKFTTFILIFSFLFFLKFMTNNK